MKKGIAASKGYAIGNVFLYEENKVIITDEKVTDIKKVYSADELSGEGMVVRRGKKTYKKVVLK